MAPFQNKSPLHLALGFTNPILVDTQAGILAGHARLRGALQAGLPQVPVIVLDHLTETQKRAYILADNKLALNAGWDDELLAKELAALELSLSTAKGPR